MNNEMNFVYCDNVGGATRDFHDHFVALVRDGTPLPEEISDLFSVRILDGFNPDGSNRGIVEWA